MAKEMAESCSARLIDIVDRLTWLLVVEDSFVGLVCDSGMSQSVQATEVALENEKSPFV